LDIIALVIEYYPRIILFVIVTATTTLIGLVVTDIYKRRHGSKGYKAVSLEEAIQLTAAEMLKQLDPGTRVAVVDFKALSPELSDYIIEELILAMGKGNKKQLRVIDRNNLDYVVKEQRIQLSGDVSNETAVSIGKMLGARSVVIGSLSAAGNAYRFRAAVVNVETLEREVTTALTLRNNRSFRQLAASLQRPGGSPAPQRAAIDYGPPENAGAFLDRGISFALNKDYDTALADFTDALRLDPNLAAAYTNRGAAYADKGDIEKALADFTDALRLDPDNAAAYYNRGVAHAKKSDIEKALADFTDALRLDPNYAAAYANRGVAYDEKGDIEKALADYAQAIRVDSNHAAAYANRGIAYAKKGDIEKALADYDQALRLDPNHAAAYYSRGNAYFNKGDIEKALADFTDAIRLDPNHAAAYTNRGAAYATKGDYDRAIADLTAALKIDPDNAAAKANLEIARMLSIH
jgi:tetratricopeptide (TPR) repeat protein